MRRGKRVVRIALVVVLAMAPVTGIAQAGEDERVCVYYKTNPNGSERNLVCARTRVPFICSAPFVSCG